MKISNFKLTERTAGDRWGIAFIYKGTVEVTTGIWLWKKTQVKEVILGEFASFWRWADTGKMTQGFKVEEAVKVFEAKHMCCLSKAPLV